MFKSFKASLQEFINDRAYNISDTIFFSNLDYMELTEKCNNLHNLIKKHLPEEHKHLIGTYEETENMINAIIIKNIYEQGFKDGIELINYVSRISSY